MATNQIAYSAYHQYRGTLGNISYPVFIDQYWDKGGLARTFQIKQDKLLSDPYPEVKTVNEKLRSYFNDQINVVVSNISKLLQNKTAAKRDSIMRNDETIANNVNHACETVTRFGSAETVLKVIGVQTPLTFQQDMTTQICQRIGKEWPEFHKRTISGYDSEKFIRHFRKCLERTSLPETRLVTGATIREQSHEASLEIMQSAFPPVNGAVRLADDGKALPSLRTPFNQAVDNSLSVQKFVAPGLGSMNKPPPGLIPVAGAGQSRPAATTEEQRRKTQELRELWEQEEQLQKEVEEELMNEASLDLTGLRELKKKMDEVKRLRSREEKAELDLTALKTKYGTVKSECLEPIGNGPSTFSDQGPGLIALESAVRQGDIPAAGPGLITLAEVADGLSADGPMHEWLEKHKAKKEKKREERAHREAEEHRRHEGVKTEVADSAATVDGPVDYLRRKRQERRDRHRMEEEERERLRQGEGRVNAGEAGGPLSWLDDEAEKLRKEHERRHRERYDEHEERRRERERKRSGGLVKGETFDIGNHKHGHQDSSESSSASSGDLRESGSPFSSTSSSASTSDDESDGHTGEFKLPVQSLFTANQRPALIPPEQIGQTAPAQTHNLQRLTADHPLAKKLLQTQRVQSQVTEGATVTTATAYLKKYLAAEGSKLAGSYLVFLAPSDEKLNPVKNMIEQHENPNKVTQFAALHLFHDTASDKPLYGRSFVPVAPFGQSVSISQTKMIKSSSGETPALAEPSFFYDEVNKIFVRILPQGSIIRPQQ
jgi:hypothetical protein